LQECIEAVRGGGGGGEVAEFEIARAVEQIEERLAFGILGAQFGEQETIEDCLEDGRSRFRATVRQQEVEVGSAKACEAGRDGAADRLLRFAAQCQRRFFECQVKGSAFGGGLFRAQIGDGGEKARSVGGEANGSIEGEAAGSDFACKGGDSGTSREVEAGHFGDLNDYVGNGRVTREEGRAHRDCGLGIADGQALGFARSGGHEPHESCVAEGERTVPFAFA